jgi:protein-disulfide isomerase
MSSERAVFRVASIFLYLAAISSAETCAPLSAELVSRIEIYAELRFKVLGGVVAVTDKQEEFPAGTCLIKLPLRAKVPGNSFGQVVTVSPDRKYFATELMDLTKEPRSAEQLEREAIRSELGRNPSGDVHRRDMIQVVVFSDFQCAYCKSLDRFLHSDGWLHKESNVSVIYRNRPLPSHAYARTAALIGLCVRRQSEHSFETYDQMVFDQQERIFSSSDPKTELMKLTESTGASNSSLQKCLNSEWADAELKADQDLADKNAVNVTPTVFIDDFRIDGLPTPQEFRSAIQIAEKQKPQFEPDNNAAMGSLGVRVSETPDDQMPMLHDTLIWARIIAGGSGSHVIEPADLILGALRGPLLPDSANAKNRIPVLDPRYYESLKVRLKRDVNPTANFAGDFLMTAESKTLLERARSVAGWHHDAEVSPLHLLKAAFGTDAQLSKDLESIGLSEAKLDSLISKAKQ